MKKFASGGKKIVKTKGGLSVASPMKAMKGK